jgi:hypothetical protein
MVGSDSAHLVQVFDVEDIASDMPPEVPWLAVSNAPGNLRKVASGIGFGDAGVLRPSFAGLGIQTKRFQRVAAALSARNAFWTAPHGLDGDIHDGTELAIATADRDTLIAWHSISPWVGPRLTAWTSALWLLDELAYEGEKGRGRQGSPPAVGYCGFGDSLINRTREIVRGTTVLSAWSYGMLVDGLFGEAERSENRFQWINFPVFDFWGDGSGWDQM